MISKIIKHAFCIERVDKESYLIDSNVVNGYKENFYEILITDENNNNRIKFENFVKGEIYFFQGPPGTGKTYTIKRIIEENETKGTYEKIIVNCFSLLTNQIFWCKIKKCIDQMEISR